MTQRNKFATQGRLLILELKKRAMTYLDMYECQCGLSPHKRVVESLRDNEQLIKGKNGRGFVTWKVVPVRKGGV